MYHFILILAQLFFINIAYSQVCIDLDGDGWGWTGTASCKVNSGNNTYAATPQQPSNPSSTGCIDTDGDGWGWDGSGSCKVNSSNNTQATPQQPSSPTTTECIDTDGDGWGWNGSGSCKVNSSNNTQATPQQPSSPTTTECIDTDGDGWGWDGSGSCRIGQSITNNYPSPITNPEPAPEAPEPQNIQCDNIRNLGSNSNLDARNYVTDVILTAGQSNAAGNNTRYDPENNFQDEVSPRLLAWTTNGWQVANPRNQTWDIENRQPYWSGRTHNHPAFQIGNAIVRKDPCKVVAIIATAAPGQGITYWLDNENNHYKNILSKVSSALDALPGNKSKVDMIWWMQGETDDGVPKDVQYTNIRTLVDKFRVEPWFDYQSYFLANETRVTLKVNQAIRMLRGDGDNSTDYSLGEDTGPYGTRFPSIASEAQTGTFVHYNEQGLRNIGDEVANKYLNFFR